MKNNDLLLVIDFQNVYLPEGDWACPTMPQAVKNTRYLMDSGVMGKTIITQYLAPQNPVGRWKEYNREYAAINENAYLCDLADEIKPYLSRAELVVKSTYSSLSVPAVREAALRADHVLLSGVVAECCILATMMEAIDLGIHVIYLEDCVAGQSEENVKMVRKLAELFSPMHTQVTDSRSYLAGLSLAR